MPRHSKSAARNAKKLAKKKAEPETEPCSDDDFEDVPIRHSPPARETSMSRTTNATATKPTEKQSGGEQAAEKEKKKEWNKQLRKQAEEELAEIMGDRPPIRSVAADFPTTEFPTWDAFDDAFDLHAAANYLCMRIRTSVSRKVWNTRSPCDLYAVLGEDDSSRDRDVDESSDPVCTNGTKQDKSVQAQGRLLPASFEVGARNFWCTHGCWNLPKGTGQRVHKHVRWTGCPARMIAEVAYRLDESGVPQWYIYVKRGQTTEHNHHRTPELFGRYLTNSTIKDEELLGKFHALIQADAETVEIASYMSNESGIPFSSQAVRNMAAACLGGSTSDARMDAMLAEFANIEGSRRLYIRDSFKKTCAFAVQTQAQADVFERWPEVIVMDWTYSTNDRGYHLGSLIVTTAVGRGLSVLDFFALSEREEILQEILNFFKSRNPAWTRIESFIIDKDFTERKVLKNSFANAWVFLCQIHALRAVGRALAKHGVSPRVRGLIEHRFKQLIDCEHPATYDETVASFRVFVATASSRALKYFEDNWLNCHLSWCNVGRAQAFTCGNTTTNRVESSWKHLKDLIRHKTAMEKTFSKLLQRQANGLRIVGGEIGEATSSTRTFHGMPHFLRRCLALVSDFALSKLDEQWTKYTASKPGVSDDVSLSALARTVAETWQIENRGDTEYCVKSQKTEYTVRVVDEWCCTCLFHVSMRLPCQHIFAVCCDAREMNRLPTTAIHSRWNLYDAAQLVPVMSECVKALGSIRYAASHRIRLPAAIGTTTGRESSPVEYVQLKKYERSDKAVLSRQEKRKIVAAALEDIYRVLENTPTVCFHDRVDALRSAADSLVAGWSEQANDQPDTDHQREPTDRNSVPERKCDDSGLDGDSNHDSDSWSKYDYDYDFGDDGVEWDEPAAHEQDEPAAHKQDVVTLPTAPRSLHSEQDAVKFTEAPSSVHAGAGADKHLKSKHSLDFITADGDGIRSRVDPLDEILAEDDLAGLDQIPVLSLLQPNTQSLWFQDCDLQEHSVASVEVPSVEFPSVEFPSVEETSVEETSVEVPRTTGKQTLQPQERAPYPERGEPVRCGDQNNPIDIQALEDRAVENDLWYKRVLEKRKGRRSLALRYMRDNEVAENGEDPVAVGEPNASGARKTTTSQPEHSPSNPEAPSTAAGTTAGTRPSDIVEIQLAPRAKGKQRNDDTTNRKKKRLKVSLPQWVGLDDFVFWMARHDVPADIKKAVSMYPVVSIRASLASVKLIPRDDQPPFMKAIVAHDRMMSMKKAVHDERKKKKHNTYDVSTDSSEVYAVSFADFKPESDVFTESYITAASTFYDMSKHRRNWNRDLNWLTKEINPKPSTVVDCAFTAQQMAGTATHISRIVANLITVYKKTPLLGKFYTPLSTNPLEAFAVTLVDLVDRLTDQAMLSDTTLQFALHTTCYARHRQDCIVLDSLWSTEVNFDLPAVDINTVKYVVSPRLVNGNHWVVAVFEFDFSYTSGVCNWMYDPMMVKDNYLEIGKTFIEVLLPFLERWLRRDAMDRACSYFEGSKECAVDQRGFGRVTTKCVMSPAQDSGDGVNCGFLCVLAVNNIINNIDIDASLLQPNRSLTDNDVLALRLRTMHLVLCDSCYMKPTEDDGEEQMRIHRVDNVVQKRIRS